MDAFEIFKITKCFLGFGFLVLTLYFFLLDYYKKMDLGKKLTKIEILFDNDKCITYTMLKHAILKFIFGVIWPVSFIYYMIKKRMIYDEYLGISIIDKNIGI